MLGQQIHITLRFELATGKVTLNEIVYRLLELRDQLMLAILREVLLCYDEWICERLTGEYPSTERRGLGRHRQRGSPQGHLCRATKAIRRGKRPRHFITAFGRLKMPICVVECKRCGVRYAPLLDAIGMDPYARREGNFERQLMEAVIETTYRRLIRHRGIGISLGGLHNMVAHTDLDKLCDEQVNASEVICVMADGTALKQYRGSRGELRVVLGVSTSGRVVPLGCFANTHWGDIERHIRARLKDLQRGQLCFLYDVEPSLDGFLSDVANSQRCVWHGPRGLYHSLWKDGLGRAQSGPYMEEIKRIIGVELPRGSFELVSEKDRDRVRETYLRSRKELDELIEVFRLRGYRNAVRYLEALARRIFTHVEIWLETGVIAHRSISALERVFREIGRRLKKIAWGWSDSVATKMAKIIMIKWMSTHKWEQYWMDKLGIHGNCQIKVESVAVTSCHNF